MAVQRLMNTGNLPHALATTAVRYESKDETSALVAEDGKRIVHVPYKNPTKKAIAAAGENATFPASFTVQVPLLTMPQVVEVDKGAEFMLSLVHDYQKALIHRVADKESSIDPLNIQAFVADYFDTSRERDQPTRAEVEAWYDSIFMPAFTLKLMESGKWREEQVAAIVKNYKGYIKEVVGRVCGLSQALILTIKNNTEKMIADGLMDKSEESDFVVSQCNKFMAKPEEMLVDVG